MKGYKYRGLKYFDRDLESLIKNQIYAPLFIELNDPFENTYNDSIRQFLKIIEKIFNADSTDVSDRLKDIENYKKKLGVFSLSKTYSEKLLWAHYAEAHKGFCIEYETDLLKDKYLAPQTVNTLEIKYKRRPPILTTNDIGQDSLLVKLFATKSSKWEYEKEVRLIFDTNSFKDYHSSALTGIYFGTEFPSDKKQSIIDSLNNRDIMFYEIYRDKNSYNLKRKLVHINKRIISKKLDSAIYEILSTNHYPKTENFNVLYKNSKRDYKSLKYFFDSFRENYATKDCNISLFDDKSVSALIDKYPLTDNEYVKLADHFIAVSYFETPNEFEFYPNQDFQYKEKAEKIVKNINGP